MSLEEVREDGAAVATLNSPPDSSSTEEKPKAVRRRRTTKTAETSDSEGTASPTTAEISADDAPAKPVRKRVTRKKDDAVTLATETTSGDSSARQGELTLPLETKPVKTTRVRAKASTAPAEAVVAPSAPEAPADVPSVTAPNPAVETEVKATPALADQQPTLDIPTPTEVGLNPVVTPEPPSLSDSAPSTVGDSPVQFIQESGTGSYVPSKATPGSFDASDRIDSDRGQAAAAFNASQDGGNTSSPAPESLLPIDSNVPASREDGNFQREDGFRGEDGFRSGGRMSYRDRRALRREQRLQNRTQRFGENGAPIGEGGAMPNGGERQMNGERPDRLISGERPERPLGNERSLGGDRPERPLNGERPNDRFERSNGGPNAGRPGGNNYQMQPRRREYDMLVLEEMELPQLLTVATDFGIAEPPLEKTDLIYAILEAQAFAQNALLKKGVLEIASDGKGFLRCDGYTPADGDVYVSPTQIKRFNLKTGDMVLGAVRAPKETERFHGLLRVEAINGIATELMKSRKDFEKLTPIFPDDRFILETDQTNITARIIDLVSPIGKGQRGLIVAPPKAGKTTLLKSIANSITRNNPEVDLFVLLIDERPEEVTDISRSVRGEVVASTFDEIPENHMRVADIVMERAKRLVEMQHDVVILLDSITRLSRASNLVVTPSGRTLSGGLDPAAMYRPKRMFGAARNIEQGGSLTILATALVDTGSRMDEMIFEEFKGTGNMDLVLDRSLFDQRIFPAIDINRSGTRRDDLLLNKEELAATYHLRRTLAALDNDKAVTLLIDRLKNTKSNSHFMEVVAKSARQQNSAS